MNKYVSVGKIVNFHGIKGEAKVGYSKNQQDFFTSLDTVYLKDKDNYTSLHILSAKPLKNMMIVKFEGIDSINDILELKGKLLFVEESVIRENLNEDEFLIDELVGLEVFDNENGQKLGFVIGVSNNGASDLISIKTNSKKISLVPFVKAIVPIVDIKNKKIMINNIEGLLE
ncbi:MAG: 16S rRNA processing protein RimM [Candidatus Melainabacteria bacterium]|jgi:16S rRNA processing protein rimM|nr:MAG: 16S rRNA processing protein RimM [Candidatus Melainabacteria bacterium]